MDEESVVLDTRVVSFSFTSSVSCCISVRVYLFSEKKKKTVILLFSRERDLERERKVVRRWITPLTSESPQPWRHHPRITTLAFQPKPEKKANSLLRMTAMYSSSSQNPTYSFSFSFLQFFVFVFPISSVGICMLSCCYWI